MIIAIHRVLPLGLCIAGAALGCGDARPAPAPCPANAITLQPGSNVEKTVRSAAAGTSFCFAPGLYRRSSIIPRNGQKFFGEAKRR